MPAFSLVEQYRAESRAASYTSLDDEEVAEMRRRLADAHSSNAIEGIHPTPELEALFVMFVEERAPADVLGPYVDRYIAARLVTGAAAVAV